MSSPAPPRKDGSTEIWTCLNAQIEDQSRPNNDEIGLLDMYGLEICSSGKTDGPRIPMKRTELPETADVERWLASRPSETVLNSVRKPDVAITWSSGHFQRLIATNRGCNGNTVLKGYALKIFWAATHCTRASFERLLLAL